MTTDPLLVQAIGSMQEQITGMSETQTNALENIRTTIHNDIQSLQKQEREDVEKLWDTMNLNQKETNACLQSIKLSAQVRDGKIKHLNQNIKQAVEEKKKRETLEKLFFAHQNDGETHYNPHYKETFPQKLWRKKPEISAGAGLGALIVAIITWMIENLDKIKLG